MGLVSKNVNFLILSVCVCVFFFLLCVAVPRRIKKKYLYLLKLFLLKFESQDQGTPKDFPIPKSHPISLKYLSSNAFFYVKFNEIGKF
jgi:hypothetical protein